MKGNLLASLVLVILLGVGTWMVYAQLQPKPEAPAGELTAGGQKQLMYFTADWCPPCKKMKPIVKELQGEMTSVRFVVIDVDKDPYVAKKYGIQGIPTFVVLQNGKEVTRRTGGMSKEALKSLIGS